MTTFPVAHYLKDLNGELPKGPKSLQGHFGDGPPESDIEQKLDEAYIRGVLEGRAEAQVEFNTRSQQQSEAAEQRFKSERERWVDEEGARLGGLIVSSLEGIETRLADQVARILKPFLLEHVRQRAMAELVSAFDALLLKGEYSKITVSGPEDLVATLKTHVAGRVESIVFAVSEGATDISVTADETILETRIGGWVEAIDGVAQ
jgi:hypothetical protein